MAEDPNVRRFQESSVFSGTNAPYLEDLYDSYLQDPSALASEWRDYFDGLPTSAGASRAERSPAPVRELFLQLMKKPFSSPFPAPPHAPFPALGQDPVQKGPQSNPVHDKQYAVDSLIESYRRYGHLIANTNPLHHTPRAMPPLQLETHGLSDADMATAFAAPSLFGAEKKSLRDILAKVQQAYCETGSAQYAYINSLEEIEWIKQAIESNSNRSCTVEDKKQLLHDLTRAEGLEKFLGTKYVGQKRFSLEGGESLIPMVHALIEHAANQFSVDEVTIGMAHRGRLNVMMNILGMSAQEICDQFEGKANRGDTSGDVKYHMGYSSDQHFGKHHVHVSLAFNPSHLEIISAVVLGSTRARQDARPAGDKHKVFPILVHGDAAFTGQGVNQEILNMSKVRAYDVGGSVHIIVNNQVGFTTSNPQDSRTGTYASDVAKMVDAPIFHVNGDDPEAVLFYTRLACVYRHQFQKDVVINLMCYRRLGHNEADEPSATQPLMYAFIRQHPTTRALYADRLVKEGVLQPDEPAAWVNENKGLLQAGKQTVTTFDDGIAAERKALWAKHLGKDWRESYAHKVNKKAFVALAKTLSTVPEGFNCQRQVGTMMKQRQEMAAQEKPMRWGFAETMAYATLLRDGISIRLIGQDARRGTFSHRHAALHDVETGKAYMPLVASNDTGKNLAIYDSVLSEFGALGFEYGYATTDPRCLVLWEAQFGDFANGAQVVFDQFISSGWQKWQRACGIVVLLPHGYEGQGPEHSSARLERFLQMCAQQNIQVCVPSNAAQVYHMLRRQALRTYRRPLIVMSPKSLLRHPQALSDMEELTDGQFRLVIPESDEQAAKEVTRVVLCSGKVYYDLLAKRQEQSLKGIALVRVEQLYPFPYEEVTAELKKYSGATQIIWCQEEPKNQGAWYALRHSFEACLQKGQYLEYAGRPMSAAPAAGYPALHAKRQALLVDQALGLAPNTEETA